MKLLLALFAVLALALSPLSLAAAQAQCASHVAAAAMAMNMGSAHNYKPPFPAHSDKACAAACATIAGAVATLAVPMFVPEPAFATLRVARPSSSAANSLPAATQDRPPKLNA